MELYITPMYFSMAFFSCLLEYRQLYLWELRSSGLL